MNESKCLNCLKELPGHNKLKITKEDSLEIKERFCSKNCYDNWQKLSKKEQQKRKKELYSELEGNIKSEIKKRKEKKKTEIIKDTKTSLLHIFYGILSLAPWAIMILPKEQIILIKNDTLRFYFSLGSSILLFVGAYFLIEGLIKTIKNLFLLIASKD